MSKNGKWVEIGRERRPNGTVRVRYRACVCVGGKRTRKWFGTEEEARRWLGRGDVGRLPSPEIRTNWRFVFGDREQDVYGREARFS